MSGPSLRGAKVALVHDWLVGQGGGERALESLHRAFPEAPIYTLVYDEDKAPGWLRECDVRTTWLQRLPGAKSHHKLLLPLMPRAWEALDLTGYDLVVSSCSSCCKGVITGPDAVHVCYCHTPTRYVWDLYYDYLRDAGAVKRFFMRRMIHGIRLWDYQAAQRVDFFVSNSDYVGRRITKYYRRESTTIYNGGRLRAGEVPEVRGGYYLVVSRLVAYKRVDLAVAACSELGRRLVVVGTGEEGRRLRTMAGPTVEFREGLTDEELEELYLHADALLFPGVEDYGLVPLEAMSAGCPVLAYGEGGALETVADGETGLLFHEQTAESLAECIRRFEREGVALAPREIAARTAERFSEERFRGEMLAFCETRLEERGGA